MDSNYLEGTESKEEKRASLLRSKLNIIVAGALLILLLIAAFINIPNNISLNIEDNLLEILGPKKSNFSTEVYYDDIISVEVMSPLRLGECISGESGDKNKFGTWKNDTFGEYTLCVYSNVFTYIVIETSDGYTVFNCDSKASTTSFYDAFIEMLNE